MIKISMGGLQAALKKLSSQLLLVLLIVAIVAFVGMFIWQSIQIKDMQAKFQQKQTELAAVVERNDRLQEHLDFYNSPGYMLYVEKVAREALGLAKPGETVVLAVPDTNSASPSSASNPTGKDTAGATPNQSTPKKPSWQNWLGFFFGK